MNPDISRLEKEVTQLERKLVAQDEELARLRLARGLDLHSEKREMLTAESAQKQLKECIEGKENIEYIRLGTKSFGKEAASVAAETLSKLQDITSADMSDIIAGRPEAEALEVLQIMCGSLPLSKLRKLDLSENALGEKGIRALEQVLVSLKELEEIKFANDGLSELSVKLLAEYLPVEKLKVLQFHNNMSGCGGAKAAATIVEKCKVLQDFRMSSSRVKAEGGLPLIKALCKSAATLRSINLSDSMFDEECSEVLVDGLKNMPELRVLILRDTGVDKDMLLEALENPSIAPKLSLLDISGLELDPDCAEQVGRIIGSRPKLQKVWMDDNELESEGITKFCLGASKCKSICTLEYISAQSNQIGQKGAYALVKFALTLPTMTKIELDDNHIAADGLAKIQTLIGKKGRPGLLGSMEENADDDDEDEDLDDEEGEDEEDDLSGLTSALEKSLAIDQ